MKRLCHFRVLVLAAFLAAHVSSLSSAETAAVSKGETALTAAANSQKFTFILFWKENDAATQEMQQILKQGLAKRAEQATWVAVRTDDPAEKKLIDDFQLSRAPVPMILAVAPNRAITGVYTSQPTEANLHEGIVSPCMTRCMKSMQGGKLVLLCVQTSPKAALPKAVQDFQADPQFSKRIAVQTLQCSDPAEAKFLKNLQIDPATAKTQTTVFMAPPGVLIGKFTAEATKDQMAEQLHAAGKCCDDPNCKHNKKGG